VKALHIFPVHKRFNSSNCTREDWYAQSPSSSSEIQTHKTIHFWFVQSVSHSHLSSIPTHSFSHAEFIQLSHSISFFFDLSVVLVVADDDDDVIIEE